MDDTARLNIEVKHGSIGAAQQSLDKLTDSSRKTGSATRELYAHMDSLTRAMDKMMDVQRRTNQLVLDGVTAQQHAARSTEQNISSMTRLTVGISAASAAWSMFSGSTRQATDQTVATTQQMNALAASLDNVLNRFKQLQSQNFDLSKLVVNTAFGFGNVGFGAPYTGGIPQSQSEQMNAAIQAMALRSGLSGSSLLRGANTGNSLGVGSQGGADMTAQMQRNLNGMSLEALHAQRTMRDFGVTTTDAVTALREFLKALGNTKDDPRRLASLQAVLPGADPAILARGNISMLNPGARTEAAYQRQQEDEVARLRAITVDVLDRTRAAAQQSTLFMGVRQSFGNALGAPANMAREEVFKAQADQQFNSLIENLFGKGGTWTGAGQAGANLLATAGRRVSNTVSGLTLGMVEPPDVPSQLDERAPGPRTAQERALLRDYERRLGRMSPGAMSERITEEREAGSNLVKKGLLEPGQFDHDMARLEETLRRIADPVSHMVELLGQQSRTAGMTPASRQRAGLVQQAGNLAIAAGDEGVSASSLMAIDRNIEEQRRGHGQELTRQATQQIEETKGLSKAYGENGNAIQWIKAQYQAWNEVIAGTTSATQVAARSVEIFNQSVAEFGQQMSRAMRDAGIRNTATGRAASAAASGPTAVRRAGVEGQLDTMFADAVGDPATIAQQRATMRGHLLQDQINEERQRGNEQARTRANRNADFAGIQGGGDLTLYRFSESARANLAARGIDNPTAGQIKGESQTMALEASRQMLVATKERSRETAAIMALEEKMPAAIAAGVAAEKDLVAQIKIEEQYRKSMDTAIASGSKEQVESVKREQDKALAMERQKDALQVQNAVAREKRSFDLELKNLQLETGALTSGGTSAMELQSRSNSYATRLINSGVPEGEARAEADRQAKLVQGAEDYKKAITEASTELKTGMKDAVNGIVDGLTNAVGSGKSLGDTFRSILKDLDKVGVNYFVKGPLGKMLDNAVEGKGFTTGAGGKSGEEVRSASMGGLMKSLGLDSGSDSSSSDEEASYAKLMATEYHSGGRVIRMHDGGDDFGLSYDEVPAILQTGETVLNRDESQAYQAALGEYGADPKGMWDAVKAVGKDVSWGVGNASQAWLGSYNDALSGQMSEQPMGRLRALGTLGLGAPVGALVGGEAALFNQIGARFGNAMDIGSLATKFQYAGGAGGAGAGYDRSSGSFVDAQGNHWYHGGGFVRKYHEGGSVSDIGGMGGTLLAGAAGGGIGYLAADAMGPLLYGRYWKFATKQEKAALRQEMGLAGALGGAALKMLLGGGKKGGGGGKTSSNGSYADIAISKGAYGDNKNGIAPSNGKGFGGTDNVTSVAKNSDETDWYKGGEYLGTTDMGGNKVSGFTSPNAIAVEPLSRGGITGPYGSREMDWTQGGGPLTTYSEGGAAPQYVDSSGLTGGYDLSEFGSMGPQVTGFGRAPAIDLSGGVFHNGGVVWPRMHNGGLLPDEIPIIAQTGERVLSRSENKDYEQGGNNPRGGDVHIQQNIYTPDAHSFRASSAQTAAASVASQVRAQRAR